MKNWNRRLNLARMASTRLDGAIILAKLLAFALLAFTLTRCGGAAFDAVDAADAAGDVLGDRGAPDGANGDSAPDGADAHDAKGVDAGLDAVGDEHDATPGEAATEAAAEAGVPEAAPVCTPLGTSTFYCEVGDNLGYNGRDSYCVVRPSQPSVTPTPAACQCVETYNCACVEANYANGGCGTGTSIASCQYIATCGGPNGEPCGLVVTCQ